MDSATHYMLEPIHVLMLSVLVLYLGLYINRKIRLLAENYIPPAVTGGLSAAASLRSYTSFLTSRSASTCRFAMSSY